MPATSSSSAARERRLALAVERLVGQRELVTRPLPAEVGDGAALSGGAVLSNGEIALIVDCDALADACTRRSQRRPPNCPPRPRSVTQP